MIDLSKLDINDEHEAEIICRKVRALTGISSLDLYGDSIGEGATLFGEVPGAMIQFVPSGACAVWQFRGHYFTTPTVSLDKLPLLLMQQWLIYKEKVAEYEETHCATSEVG